MRAVDVERDDGQRHRAAVPRARREGRRPGRSSGSTSVDGAGPVGREPSWSPTGADADGAGSGVAPSSAAGHRHQTARATSAGDREQRDQPVGTPAHLPPRPRPSLVSRGHCAYSRVMKPYGVALAAGAPGPGRVHRRRASRPRPTTAARLHGPARTTAPTSPSPRRRATTEVRRVPRFSARRAMADVRHLAGDIGPRLATGPAFREAARWVEDRFTDLHYEVTRQTYPVPAGASWGVPVRAGTVRQHRRHRPRTSTPARRTTWSARTSTRSPWRPGRRTTPRASPCSSRPPGVARAAQPDPGRLRGVRRRGAPRAGRPAPLRVEALRRRDEPGRAAAPARDGLPRPGRRRAAADRRLGRRAPRRGSGTLSSGPPTASASRTAIEENTGSDHESFADEGLPARASAARRTPPTTPAQDVPAVVDPAQLRRTGGVLWAWLSPRAR